MGHTLLFKSLHVVTTKHTFNNRRAKHQRRFDFKANYCKYSFSSVAFRVEKLLRLEVFSKILQCRVKILCHVINNVGTSNLQATEKIFYNPKQKREIAI